MLSREVLRLGSRDETPQLAGYEYLLTEWYRSMHCTVRSWEANIAAGLLATMGG